MNRGEFLKLDYVDRVATVTLNRPDVLNALNPLLMRGLVDVLGQLAEDEMVRCVVLTGAGRGFCAGGDVRAIDKAADELVKAAPVEVADRRPNTTEQRARWLRRCAEASRLLHEMPKPSIAMINGACAGAGLSLAAACDFRYASASAVFRSAFLVNGVSGDYGGSWLWSRILGPSKARQLYFHDQRRDAKAALEFGLVDELFADADLVSEVMARAQQLADLPGAAAAFAKANLNAALEESFAESLDRESLGMMLSRNVLVEARRKSEAARKSAADSPLRNAEVPPSAAAGRA